MATSIKKVAWIFVGLSIVIGLVIGLLAWREIDSLPNIKIISRCHNTSMNKVYLCSDSPNYVKFPDISQHIVDAIVISEDASFYYHKGFDWDEIKLTIITNLERFRFARGGSTITQQLAKNIFLTPEKSIWRKLREAYRAREMEQKYSKEVLLEKYLNVIELGTGLYGVKMASGHYFGKQPHRINFLEAAFLAYLLPNPKSYEEVFENRELTEYAKRRILTICRKMKLFKKITDEQYLVARTVIDSFPWDDLDPGDQQIISGDYSFEDNSLDDSSLLEETPSELDTSHIDKDDRQQE